MRQTACRLRSVGAGLSWQGRVSFRSFRQCCGRTQGEGELAGRPGAVERQDYREEGAITAGCRKRP